MKHLILHYFFVLYLCNVDMSAATDRHRFRSGHYDINGFISQLLASSKFDELAEKLAEKAAQRIMHIKEDQAPVDRANDNNEVQINTETTTENTQTQSEEKREKEHIRKGFSGKIDAKAVMNESILISENLMLKYNLLKKNALESKVQKENETVSKNVTNVEGKKNKTMEPVVGENNEKEGQPASKNTTQRNEDDVKKELTIERDIAKSEDQKVEEPVRNIEPYFFHYSPRGERNESSQKNDQQTEEPSTAQDEREKIFRVEHNSAAQPEEQEAIKLDNGIKEDMASSLDEQNRNYSPSDENETNAGAEMERNEDYPQMRGQEEIVEVGHGAYFRGREDSVKENVVPWSESPNSYGGIDRSVDSNDSSAAAGRGSHELFPEDKRSTENENVPAKPVNRTEGDKVYTYNQDSDYQEYHEQIAKWRKKHPDNPAEFL